MTQKVKCLENSLMKVMEDLQKENYPAVLQEVKDTGNGNSTSAHRS